MAKRRAAAKLARLALLLSALRLAKRRTGKRGMKKTKKRRYTKKQRGAGFGAGMALGTMAPMLLGTIGKILKISV
jgi:hypothetical protein